MGGDGGRIFSVLLGGGGGRVVSVLLGGGALFPAADLAFARTIPYLPQYPVIAFRDTPMKWAAIFLALRPCSAKRVIASILSSPVISAQLRFMARPFRMSGYKAPGKDRASRRLPACEPAVIDNDLRHDINRKVAVNSLRGVCTLIVVDVRH